MSVKISDCCKAGWYVAGSWVNCENCDRVCVLVENKEQA